VVPSDFEEHKLNITLNTRARLRTLLYYFAGVHGLLVGTGNKVEDFGVGFTQNTEMVA
jgi:NAD+ synthase